MAKIFNNNSNGRALTQRELLEQKYNRSIANLLLVIIFSVINIVLLVINSDTYFLFSAFVPYLFAYYGMYFGGMFPEEYYYDMPEPEFYATSFFVTMVAIAIVIVVLYFLSWLFARKRKVGWLIVALVLFAVDTIVMFYFGISADSIFDILFHVWVLFYLIGGIRNYFKLKNLPEEGEDPETFECEGVQEGGNSSVLRMADTEVKARILLEADALGHHIVFRRVKRVNELVIDGKVYDEYEALAEGAHTLCAYINGHKIEANFDGVLTLYIFVDSQQVAKKIRLY